MSRTKSTTKSEQSLGIGASDTLRKYKSNPEYEDKSDQQQRQGPAPFSLSPSSQQQQQGQQQQHMKPPRRRATLQSAYDHH